MMNHLICLGASKHIVGYLISILAVIIAGGTWAWSWHQQRKQALAEQRFLIYSGLAELLHFYAMKKTQQNNSLPSDTPQIVRNKVAVLFARPTTMKHGEIKRLWNAIAAEKWENDDQRFNAIQIAAGELQSKLKPGLIEIMWGE